jgi:hypothetical protein
MDNRQTNRYGALIKVQSFFNDHIDNFDSVPSVGEAKEDLDELMAAILAAEIVASGNISGGKEQKADLRKAFTDSILRVCRGAKAYANDTDNTMLLSKVGRPKSTITKLRDAELVVVGMQVSKAVTPIIGDLANYAVTPAMLQDVTDRLDAFFDQISLPYDLTLVRVAAGKEVDRLIAEAYSLLEDRMDSYMDLFLHDLPNLVARYYLARAIDDRGGRRRSSAANNDPLNGRIAANTSITSPIDLSGKTTVTLQNHSKQSLQFQFMAQQSAIGDPHIVKGKSTLSLRVADLNALADGLHITNASILMVGAYTVSVH